MDGIRRLPSRQVHLDFHTGPYIPDVAKRFDKKQFQEALKLGNLNSVTVFAKCHHGFTYYPSRYSLQHPNMEPGFDLTGAMVDAAHEIGVDAPIYVTMGFSEDDAARHPEWCVRNEKGELLLGMPEDADADAPRPFSCWALLCPSGEYAELEYRLVEEICARYPVVDGVFIDIVYMNGGLCWCDNCMRRMREMGRDPYSEADNRANYEETHHVFAQRVTGIVHRYHPRATVFFNSGGAEIYHPNRHADQTHFEMEDLPTAWGGYDKLAPRASVMRRYRDKEYLGMTGKFHTQWGEFGGYKNPDALTYEALVMGMYGAKCSIGDQMPPSGEMDLETYRLIGQAYRAYERYEPWFFGAEDTARLGVYLSGSSASDEGLHKMLLERQYDFRVVLPGDDLSGYDALILPDCVELPEEEIERIRAFRGGVIVTGESLVKDGAYALDFGCAYEGASPYRDDYFKACGRLGDLWVTSPFYCYKSAARLRVTDGETLAQVYDPWFNRTKEKFCSHRNTPYRPEPSGYAAAVRKGNRICFAHRFPELYYETGAQLFRDALILALESVYTPVCRVKMPSAGRMRLTRQEKEGRFVLHLTYAQPIRRGDVTVLEDMPELRDVPVEIRTEKPVRAVRVAGGEEIPFTLKDGVLRFAVPSVRMYEAVEILTEEA